MLHGSGWITGFTERAYVSLSVSYGLGLILFFIITKEAFFCFHPY